MGDQMVDVILFALVALFFGFQLWRVLGRKTDDGRPPQMPPTTLSRTGQAAPIVSPLVRPVAPAPTVLQSQPVPIDPVQAGIEQIAKADGNFRPNDFLAGARHAFEIIVQAFARGDTNTLRSLVSPEVFATFDTVITERAAARQTAESRLDRLDEPQIVDTRLDGRLAFLTVKFVSDQISVTRAEDGAVIEGDADHSTEHVDLWTFSRDTRARDPNWLLVATDAPL